MTYTKRQKNKDGTYSYLLRCMVNKKTYSKTVRAETEAKAKKQDKLFALECEQGKHSSVCTDTVETMLNTVLETNLKPVIKKNTYRGYLIIQTRFTPYIGNLRCNKVTPFQIQKLVNALSEKYAPKTVKNSYTFLAECFKTYVSWGFLKDTPCKDIRMPRQNAKPLEILNADDVKDFIKALSEMPIELQDVKVAFLLALFSGLRKGEICGLNESDFKKDKITINGTRYRQSKETWVDSPKSKKSKRTLFIPEVTSKNIEKLMVYHKSLKLKQGTQWVESEALIKKPNGEPIRPDFIYEMLQKILEKNGIKKVSLHSLRHSYASLLNFQGKPLEEISQTLGHSQTSTTMNIYIDLFEEFSRVNKKTADGVNKFIKSV